MHWITRCMYVGLVNNIFIFMYLYAIRMNHKKKVSARRDMGTYYTAAANIGMSKNNNLNKRQVLKTLYNRYYSNSV